MYCRRGGCPPNASDGKAVGSIDNIDDKGKAIVNYGVFTTNVSLDQLEFVEAVKK